MARRNRSSGAAGTPALVAAASKIRLDRKPTTRPKQDARQDDAWAYFDDVPEIKELFLWRSNQIAKLRLFAAVLPEDAGPEAEPIPVTDEASGVDPSIAKMAQERVNRLKSRIGGQAELLRRAELNLECVGEVYIVGFGERPPDPSKSDDDGEPEEWIAASVSEISYKATTANDGAGTWTIKRHPDDKKGRELDKTLDDVFRVWQPHARWGELADCAMLGTLTECEALQLLSAQIRAEAKSRAGAGIFTIPNELTATTANPIPAAGATDAETPQDADEDPTLRTIAVGITSPIDDPASGASVIPVFLRGPKEAMTPDVLRKIDLSRQSDATLDARIEARIERIARGLDAPPEVMKGHQQTTFANASQVNTDTWEKYLEPRAGFTVDAFTVGYLRPKMIEPTDSGGDGIDPLIASRIFVWYDASDLVAQPNPADSANEGHDRNVISDRAWRQAKGYSEDDAPEPLELLTRVALRSRGGVASNVVNALLELLEGAPELPDPTGNSATGPDASASARIIAELLVNQHRSMPAVTATAIDVTARRRASDLGHDLVALDRELRTRLLIESSSSMRRALERAGNRLRSKAGTMRDTLRNVPPLSCAATIGPALMADAGFTPNELLEGAFDGLRDQFLAWGVTAQRQAIELVNKVVGGFSRSERDELGLRLAESLDEAWGWMHEALTSLAEAQLFDPTPAAPALGEFDPTLRVPPGLVRQAVSRAGGSAGLQSAGQGDAWVIVGDSGTRPAGGIGTGEIMRGALRDHGVGVEGYEWEYGVGMRARPFEPHRALNGRTFTNFDDPVLANGHGWPPYPYFMPGDHNGCLCDAVPILLPAED
jgi:hypothetical protein